MSRYLYILLFLLLPFCGKAQVAGLSTLSVLDMPSSARTAGLGMDYLALYDNDLTIGFDNPSLLNQRVHNRLLVNYVGLFDGSNFGAVAYGRHFDKIGDFLFGLRFNSYGSFEGYDQNDQSTGSFFAADYVFSVGYGKRIDSCFSIGVNLKPTLSQYEHYTAFALAMDVMGSFVSRSKAFAATIAARNFGAQLASFDGSVEKLPFELSFALSYKLENAPFRFFFAANELQRWNLRYDDPLHPLISYDPYTQTYTQETWIHRTSDLLFRHAVFGVELSINQVFFARIGYNYRKSAENYGTTNLNTTGFSYGFGIRKKRFEFAFARNNYYLGKAPNYITLQLGL